MIKKENGLLFMAARKLGCHVNTITAYADRYQLVRDAVVEAKGHLLDQAESALYKALRKGQAWAVCFFLKTQGKSRGYIEKSELDSLEGLLGRLPADIREAVKRVLAEHLSDGGNPAGSDGTPAGGDGASLP